MSARALETDEKGIGDYLAMVRRRIWYILVPFVVLFAISAAVAMVLPPVFRSSATILIEDPDIPPELAVSMIAAGASQRLQIINQRVMASQNLSQIIRTYNLYPEERETLPITAVVDMMRDKINLELVSAKDSRGGAGRDPTIAFKVSFDHRNPQTAQRVANELVSLYLNENIRERQQRAAQTAAFFESETKRLEGVIAEQEGKLAALRQSKYGSLPEQLDFNQKLIARADDELRALDLKAQTLNERKVFLQSELAQIDPHGPYAVPEAKVLRPAEQLKVLRTQLTTALSRYGSAHPDVIRMQREVAALEQETGAAPDVSSLRLELARAEADLASAREHYTESHPETIRLSRQVDALRQSLEEAQRAARQSTASADQPDNPAYIQLQSQLQSTDMELSAIAVQREETRKRIKEYEARIESTPRVQQEFQSLTRALEGATVEFRDVRAKQMAAQMGQLLETERKSERFSLIEPPALPNKPIKPNRPAIFMIGFVLSAGAGVGLALLLEMMNSAVQSARELTRIAGAAPLAIIPYIRTRAEIMRMWRMRAVFGVGIVVLFGGAITAVHFFVMPLDSAIGIIHQRLG